MSHKYPTKKIDELNLYVLNFLNDIVYMEDVVNKLVNWNQRGIEVGESIEQLETQIIEWKNEMEKLITNFKDNILTLKKIDDRINSDDNVEFTELNGSYKEQWQYLYTIYYDIFHNLKSDINILNNVNDDIKKYKELGIKLGDAKTAINDQINVIQDNLDNSLDILNQLVEDIKDYSKKVFSEDELIENINDSLAVYSTIGVDAMTFLLYFNSNTQINWDPVVDGKSILNNVKKALISKHSPIYNEFNDNSHYETGATKLYNWIYYGFDKNNMIKAKIMNDTYGASYQDEHGYQRIINTFYDRSTNHVQKMIELFESKGLVYNPGSQTTEKLYIVYSVEEITDFSNLIFRGEN